MFETSPNYSETSQISLKLLQTMVDSKVFCSKNFRKFTELLHNFSKLLQNFVLSSTNFSKTSTFLRYFLFCPSCKTKKNEGKVRTFRGVLEKFHAEIENFMVWYRSNQEVSEKFYNFFTKNCKFWRIWDDFWKFLLNENLSVVTKFVSSFS